MIKIDTSSFVPIYEQVKTQLKLRIAACILKPHAPLPSIRELASELLINPNTVARAYREMEHEGFIYTQKGKGSFVSEDSISLIGEKRSEMLNKIFDDAIEEAKKYQLTPNEIKRLFEQRTSLIIGDVEKDSNG
jgi:GntR family transcriptional regulator